MVKLKLKLVLNKLRRKLKNHPYVWVCTVILAAFSALITINTASSLLLGYANKHILWQSVEEEKLNKIAPLESVQYVKSILGPPIYSDKINDKYSSHIFRGRDNWVYVIYEIASEKSEYVAITACNGFHPTLNNNPGYEPIKLGVTKLDGVKWSTSASTWGEIDRTPPPLEDRHYNIPEATMPLGIFEKHYLANPGRHQTIYAGFNSICQGELGIDAGVLSKLAKARPSQESLSADELTRLRAMLVVNTFAVSGNGGDMRDLEKILDSSVEIGVPSKQLEVLSPPRKPSKDEIDNIRRMK